MNMKMSMKKTTNSRNKQGGGFLLEIILGLVIFGVVLVVAASRNTEGTLKADINEGITLLHTVSGTLSKEKTNGSYGTADQTLYLFQQKLFSPSSYNAVVTGTTVVVTQKKGPPSTLTVTGNNANFIFARSAATPGFCAGLVLGASAEQYASVTIGATTTALPIATPAAAAIACGTTNNSLAFNSVG
jgi:type II secretory pathway pseudopilin PulG